LNIQDIAIFGFFTVFMKIFFDTVGCRLNQSEIESMAGRFRQEGHEVVANAAEADMVVINTCTVTAAADADSRKKIRQAARAGAKRIITTGCYATVQAQEASRIAGVEQVIPNSRKSNLVDELLGLVGDPQDSQIPRCPLLGIRKRTRAFIKVQDGCDNHCTFCITRIARGKSISRSEEEIFVDVESALIGGVKEIVLTGVNLGAWGKDLDPTRTLASLMEDLVARFSPPRLRLSSLEPWDIGDDLIMAMRLPGVCRHLHLPLQSGCDPILKEMGRKTDTQTFANTVEKIRKEIPEIALTTDLIVAFPGESESHFEESLEFVRKMAFAGGHVFRFSSRPGTAAADLPDHVWVKNAKIRNQRMRDLFNELAKQFRAGFIGKELEVLWEKTIPCSSGWQLFGLSDNYIRVATVSNQNDYNKISRVDIRRMEKNMLVGAIVETDRTNLSN